MTRSTTLIPLTLVLLLGFAAHVQAAHAPIPSSVPLAPFDPARGLLLRGTVVTMDDDGTVIEKGNVLVRHDRIVAIWEEKNPPAGIEVGDATVIDLDPDSFIFPGMINLHNHPTYNMLPLWPAPSSHAQPDRGRPLGTEPYANRYQWNILSVTSPAEYLRLVDNPQFVLNATVALNLQAEVVKYAEVKALVGGETSIQGATPLAATDGVLARNLDNPQFGRDRIESRVSSINTLTGAALSGLRARMQAGLVDAWLVHLAEGVRDGDRRPGDTTSSHAEFATLKSKGLLTDATVILHGVALEPADFAEMRLAPSIRTSGLGDGLGAKLVWSPLSNLLLYGRTASVYEALAAGVLVSLGTDWSPSGSRNLLGELKIADVALRDPRILGNDRTLVSEVAEEGLVGTARDEAERALDRLLVAMVTRNPARTLHWDAEVGSVEAGKIADLMVITRPKRDSRDRVPDSPYRRLIDATERDVRLVLVGGEPLVGDAALIHALKPGDSESVPGTCDRYEKAIDVTRVGVPKGQQTLAEIRGVLEDSLEALGGDNPPAGGGQSDDTNTYSYLRTHIALPFPMTDEQFRELVLVPFAGMAGGKLNLEGIDLAPILPTSDDFFFDLIEGRLDEVSGLIDDPTPPFKLYPANLNPIHPDGNPFAGLEESWYGIRDTHCHAR